MEMVSNLKKYTVKYTSTMDPAGQRLSLHTVAVCYSGLEILWRKVTEKIKGGKVCITYLECFAIWILVLG